MTTRKNSVVAGLVVTSGVSLFYCYELFCFDECLQIEEIGKGVKSIVLPDITHTYMYSEILYPTALGKGSDYARHVTLQCVYLLFTASPEWKLADMPAIPIHSCVRLKSDVLEELYLMRKFLCKRLFFFAPLQTKKLVRGFPWPAVRWLGKPMNKGRFGYLSC